MSRETLQLSILGDLILVECMPTRKKYCCGGLSLFMLGIRNDPVFCAGDRQVFVRAERQGVAARGLHCCMSAPRGLQAPGGYRSWTAGRGEEGGIVKAASCVMLILNVPSNGILFV